jgi:hypothetical protein
VIIRRVITNAKNAIRNMVFADAMVNVNALNVVSTATDIALKISIKQQVFKILRKNVSNLSIIL